MNRSAKIARQSWICYLFLAYPVALFCIVFLFGILYLSHVAKSGMFEFSIQPSLKAVSTLSLCVIYPISWIFGCAFAYKFNDSDFHLTPQVVNAIPLLAILGVIAFDLQAFIWLFTYIVTLIVILGISSITSVKSKGRRK